MTKETIHSRQLIGRKKSGAIVRGTAALVLLQGNSAPYFSFTTPRGADHDTLREAFEEIADYFDLHLSDDKGAPMHCEANALYWATEGKEETLASHLRISQRAAEEIIKTIGPMGKQLRPAKIAEIVAPLRPVWAREAAECIEFLQEAEPYEADSFGEVGLLIEEPAARKDGEAFNLDDYHTGGYLPEIDWNGCSYVVAQDEDAAGEAAAEHWRDMAANDPKEFACIIGEERLVQWAMGQSDSFGISSLESFCAVVAQHPEEEFARYDGHSTDIELNAAAMEALGFDFDTGKDFEDPDGETIQWFSVPAYRSA